MRRPAVAMHLERASPEGRDTFEKLQTVLAKLGPHGIVAVKTMIASWRKAAYQIGLGARHH